MAGGKSTQPLFELLAKGQSDALTRQAKQFIPGGAESRAEQPASPEVKRGAEVPVRGAPAPSVEPVRTATVHPAGAAGPSDGGVPAASVFAGATGGRRRDAGGVTVPLIGLYIGSATLLGLLFLVWSIGFHRGRGAERAEWQRDLSGGMIGADPLVDPTAGSGSQPRAGDSKQAGGTGRAPSADQNTNTGTGSLLGGGRAGILTSGGVLSADPRQPGRNYLKLATLGRADAERSIAYLAASGVETIGVPVVDPKTGSANNPARYEVFATVGITGEEYSNNRPVKVELEAKVARIGERFRREAKGPSDFAKPLWMKHTP